MKLVIAFLLVLSGFLLAEGSPLPSDIPPAPADGIYDPSQWFTSDSKLEIARDIEIAKMKWNTEVYVLVLPNRPETDVAIFAKETAEEWGKGKLWGVVLHVIGDPEFPRFFAGRKESFGWSDAQESDFSESLEKALSDVESRAMREEDQRLQVETGAREFCEELGYLGLVMTRIEKRYDKARGANLKVIQTQYTKRSFLNKLLMVLIPLILLLTVILIYLFRKMRSEAKSDFLFPETSPRKRFLAPWSGGADVIVNVGSRLREDGSRKGSGALRLLVRRNVRN